MNYTDRLWAKVDKSGECWLWTGSLTTLGGYGYLMVNYKRWRAHRLSWTLANGPIMGDAVLDHECHNIDPTCPGGKCLHRRCVNPAHLKLSTRGENTLAGRGETAKNARKTHCPRGHPLSGSNLYLIKGKRYCKVCVKGREAARRAQLRATGTAERNKEN